MLLVAVSVTIEPMTEHDLASALALDLGSVHPPPHEVRERHLREELQRTWARVRVARASTGEVLGYLLYWHVADEVHLLNVVVAETARRRGVGRALVDEMLAYARAKAAAKVLLEVRASNAGAIALYAQLGFEEINVRSRYYSDGEDGLEMLLRLDAP